MLTRTRPLMTFDPFRAVSSELDRLVNTALDSGNGGSLRRTALVPALNLTQDDTHLHLELETPGFRLEDLEILAEGNTITIRGERSEERRENTTHLHVERESGRFERTVTLPDDADLEKASASLDLGVLRIDVPRSEASRVRRITIGGGGAAAAIEGGGDRDAES